ncbi:MAG: hypothetical protein QY316_04335 [Thermodesulfobacteriota bacterium]|nr:MAG: hypothetical protein QY316_04335 [Thermodesulfobacteriota bacterium]
MKSLLKFSLQLSTLFFVVMLFYGCASIIGKGSPQVVTINSNPSDANLKIEDSRTGSTIYAGKTPYTATLTRGAGYFKSARYDIVLEKDGYQTRQFIIQGSPNGWYIGGNFIFGGLIGWLIVDPLTGAMWTLSPAFINADLGTKSSLIKTGDGLVIVMKSEVPEELHDKLVPVAEK